MSNLGYAFLIIFIGGVTYPFTIILFHGERIDMEGEPNYLCGEIEVLENVQHFEIHMLLFKEKLKHLGYSDISIKFYFFLYGLLEVFRNRFRCVIYFK